MSEYPCISCEINITGRSHAIQCDVCERWQHRKCNTGITHIQYRQLQKQLIALDWSCEECRVQAADKQLELPPAPVAENDIMELEPSSGTPDTSFNVGDDVAIQRPAVIEDEELEDRPPGPDVTDEGRTTFHVMEGATRMGARMLIRSDGITYNVKRENKTTGFIYWICSVRSKANRCPALVKQYGENFISGCIQHNHPADPTKSGKLKASIMVKAKASVSMFRPAGQIVKEAMRELAATNMHVRAKPANLARAAYRHRQAMRAIHPKTQ